MSQSNSREHTLFLKIPSYLAWTENVVANSEIKDQHLGDAVGGGLGWFLKSFPNSLSSHMIRGKGSERRRRIFALPTSCSVL